jgi:hypothetical protein
VHNDHTVNSAPRRCATISAPTPRLLKHRFGIVNVWRPIRGPVQDSPLALCDARSFTDDDLIASDLVYAHVRGETSRVAHNPAHRWYYFRKCRPTMLFIPGARQCQRRPCSSVVPHLLREPADPGAPPQKHRVRTLVFFRRLPDSVLS